MKIFGYILAVVLCLIIVGVARYIVFKVEHKAWASGSLDDSNDIKAAPRIMSDPGSRNYIQENVEFVRLWTESSAWKEAIVLDPNDQWVEE